MTWKSFANSIYSTKLFFHSYNCHPFLSPLQKQKHCLSSGTRANINKCLLPFFRLLFIECHITFVREIKIKLAGEISWLDVIKAENRVKLKECEGKKSLVESKTLCCDEKFSVVEGNSFCWLCHVIALKHFHSQANVGRMCLILSYSFATRCWCGL